MANKSQYSGEKYSKAKLQSILKEAIERNERWYNNTLFDKGKDGKPITFKRAIDLRAKLKRDLCLMYLLDELLSSVDSNFEVQSEQARLGFERLTLS
jgi:hypothetical protein